MWVTVTVSLRTARVTSFKNELELDTAANVEIYLTK
jgi:hypothetical protein